MASICKKITPGIPISFPWEKLGGTQPYLGAIVDKIGQLTSRRRSVALPICASFYFCSKSVVYTVGWAFGLQKSCTSNPQRLFIEGHSGRPGLTGSDFWKNRPAKQKPEIASEKSAYPSV